MLGLGLVQATLGQALGWAWLLAVAPGFCLDFLHRECIIRQKKVKSFICDSVKILLYLLIVVATKQRI